MKMLQILSAAALVLAQAGPCPAAQIIVLNDDGAWNWLQDKRAIIAAGELIVGSVAMGRSDPERAGDIEVVSCNLKSHKIRRSTLHHETTVEQRRRWQDDHSAPALLLRPDGRILAMYSTHGKEPSFFHRLSGPGDATAWGEERKLTTAAGSRVTFPNLVQLPLERNPLGRILLFFRGLHNRLMPSLAHSDDGGETWQTDGVLMSSPEKRTPYVKVAGDSRGTVHLAFTDGHRVNFNNGVYHAMYRGGRLWRSNGEPILATNDDGIISTTQATEVFRANENSVAMISDIALDSHGHPCIVYSVQMNTRPQRPRPVGADHRYRYARWTGDKWLDTEIAHAGTETHAVPDDDCTGLIALDPQDVNRIYFSTNADPSTGAPLISKADGKRHWECFKRWPAMEAPPGPGRP